MPGEASLGKCPSTSSSTSNSITSSSTQDDVQVQNQIQRQISMKRPLNRYYEAEEVKECLLYLKYGSQMPSGSPPENGNGSATPPQMNNNDSSKKIKLAHNNPPSKVVHIRNIPTDVSETEIVHLGIPFGRVNNVLVLKGKNQAFLEMAEESAAVAMVTYFTTCAAQLRGRSVFVQYSTHSELKTDSTHSNANSAAQAALAAAQALTSNNFSLLGSGMIPTETQGGANTVLRVIVERMIFPVTLDVLHQIFSRVGKVLRIVTFTKGGYFQALIQYPDVIVSQAAKLTLDGQNIYNGGCTLKIEYSKLPALNVRYNNDKSRDYTNPTLPTGEPLVDPYFNPFNGTDGGLANFSAVAALGMTSALNGAGLFGLGTQGRYGGGGGSPFLNCDQTQFNMANRANGALGGMQPAFIPGSVLLVSNLNEQLVSPDGLFTLFGVYGDVTRVKILFNKKDSALIQMKDPSQAQLAMSFLDRLPLYGKPIRVSISKHGAVQMPKEGQPDSGLTKDFANSSLHRFKKPDSKNYQNIYPPSQTLHLSNIPTSVDEERINQIFTENGFTMSALKFFPSKNEKKMALLQLSSIEEAADALIKMHNHQLGENSHLRVSFSKSSI